MMSDSPSNLELYSLYLSTAEAVSARRGTTNQWMLSVNSAIIFMYGFFAHDNYATGGLVWATSVPLTGILVCLTWQSMVVNYRKLNRAKFAVLQELEKDFNYQLFAREQLFYKNDGRRSISRLEVFVPWFFVLLHLVLLVATMYTIFRLPFC